ncbi:hypothetical protein KDN32_02415 [Nocardioides sp. J2M5]|uniref:hypothetical protein n=1 Tax=Nocardioides palaemonis TaxID=2829810 RepID=UPI001BA924C2|nr:hypothetical protein [Nocardioides palaemonis]MBS2936593.1 hypothetical protein [Nocardioides palaemonis]
MKTIQIDDGTYDRLVVAARLMDRTVGEVVSRLVDVLASDTPVAAGPPSSPSEAAAQQVRASTSSSSAYKPPAREHIDPKVDWIPIAKTYKGHDLSAMFNPHTHEVRLTTEPWHNQVFSSPTAAAVAVVDHFSGDVRESPNTNGRKFWKVVATGKNLHSLIGER